MTAAEVARYGVQRRIDFDGTIMDLEEVADRLCLEETVGFLPAGPGEGKSTYLQDLLVKQGYARVDGATTPLPDDHRTIESYLAELREDAAYARVKKLGIWAKVK